MNNPDLPETLAEYAENCYKNIRHGKVEDERVKMAGSLSLLHLNVDHHPTVAHNCYDGHEHEESGFAKDGSSERWCMVQAANVQLLEQFGRGEIEKAQLFAFFYWDFLHIEFIEHFSKTLWQKVFRKHLYVSSGVNA